MQGRIRCISPVSYTHLDVYKRQGSRSTVRVRIQGESSMDIKEYEKLERARLERNLAYMEKGVTFIDARTAYIDAVSYTHLESSYGCWPI